MMKGKNVPLRGIADSTKHESAPPAKGLSLREIADTTRQASAPAAYFAPFENYQDPQGTGPMINNIGGFVGIVPQSGAFYSTPPVIYIAPNNPNE